MTKGTKKAASAATAVEPKTTVKKEAAKEVKKETVKEAAAEKKEAPAEKTAPAETAEKAEPKAEMTASVVFEFADKKVVAKELLANAKAAFAAAHKDVVVEDMQLYVNANDGFAYLVVNGVEYPEDKIAL